MSSEFDHVHRQPDEERCAQNSPTIPESQRLFPTTSHTLLHAVRSADAKERELSVARFCTLYYPAVYGFARLRGLSVEDAQDRTQDFFIEIVRDDLLTKFDASRGSKLSSWLMTCFKNLDLSHRTANSAAKRGGGWEFVSLDTDFAEYGYKTVLAAQLGEPSAGDLMLARSLWREAAERLREKHAGTANEALVHDVLPLLVAERWPEPPAASQQEVADRHGSTTARLKAFFNRTLRGQAERFFAEAAMSANEGITEPEIQELWALLRAHTEG